MHNIILLTFACVFISLSRIYWTDIDIEAFNIAFPGSDYPPAFFLQLPYIVIFLAPVLLNSRRLLIELHRIPTTIWFFYGLCVLSVTWSANIASSVFQILLLSICIFHALLISKGGEQLGVRICWYISLVVISASLMFSAAGTPNALMQGYHAGSIRGIFAHKNSLGPFAAFFCILTLFGQKEIPTSKLLKIFAVPIAFTAVLLSNSSTAVIMLVLGLMGGFYSAIVQKVNPRLKLSIHILTLFLFSAGAVSGPWLIEWVTDSFGKDMTLSNRTLIWSVAIPVVVDNPIGTGYGTSGGQALQQQIITQLYIPQGSSVQNGYLFTALDVGWLGPILFALWVLLEIKKKASSGGAFVPLILSYFVLGMTEVNSAFTPNAMLLVLMIYAFSPAETFTPPDSAGIRLSLRRRRLVQPEGPVVAAIDHDGSSLLHRSG